MNNQLKNISLKDYVYEKIKKMIDEGSFSIGEKIDKNELSKLFNISLTPINDALNRLVGEKYISVESRKGFYIKEYTDKELADLFSLRIGIESVAVRLCCEIASDEEIKIISSFFDGIDPYNEKDLEEYKKQDKLFHRKIIEFARNTYLNDILSQTGFLSKSILTGLVRGPEETYKEHMKIIDCLLARDADGAQKAMTKHLSRSKVKLIGK